jgi:hypothetical protein
VYISDSLVGQNLTEAYWTLMGYQIAREDEDNYPFEQTK